MVHLEVKIILVQHVIILILFNIYDSSLSWEGNRQYLINNSTSIYDLSVNLDNFFFK